MWVVMVGGGERRGAESGCCGLGRTPRRRDVDPPLRQGGVGEGRVRDLRWVPWSFVVVSLLLARGLPRHARWCLRERLEVSGSTRGLRALLVMVVGGVGVLSRRRHVVEG